MNEQEFIKQKFNDLSRRAYERGYATFSGFLNPDEISLLKSQNYCCSYALFGGYENAERCIVCFSEYNPNVFPICCIKIEPLQQKFSDKLSHRDFLGSLMNLGIERSVLGDIKLNNNIGYVFCLENMAEYITENLSRIKHTTVSTEIITDIPSFLNDPLSEEKIIVSSLRADAVIAGVYRLSRNSVSQLFNQEKIFINSRAVTKEGTNLKPEDTVSVRGYGRFIFTGVEGTTKKGRQVARAKIYK